MKANAGLWIDQNKALIAVVYDGGEKHLEVQSHVEPQRAGGNAGRTTRADDHDERLLAGRLEPYYAEVIEAVRDAEAILVFGAGEAREELHKRLLRARLGAKVEAVEAADKMTAPQILARLRERFPSSQGN